MAVAVRFLRGHATVRSADLPADRRSIRILFRDRAQLLIVRTPRAQMGTPRREYVSRQTVGTGSSGRAVVLEPFLDQLDPNDDPGVTDAQLLAGAGFKVDIIRNGAVTLDTIRHLAQYSVIYMETHAHSLSPDDPASDATVLTREQYQDQDAAQIEEGSVVPALATGDPTGHLWMGFTGQFIQKYVGTFSPGTILYINGCRITPAGTFDSDVLNKGVAAFIGWDNDVQASLESLTGAFVLSRLVAGDSVQQGVHTAVVVGLGTGSFVDGNTTVVAHLGYVGNGAVTLSNALTGTLPAPTLTPTPSQTATPAPTATPLPLGLTVEPLKIVNVHGHSVRTFQAGDTVTATVRYTISNLAHATTVRLQAQYSYRSGRHRQSGGTAVQRLPATNGRQTARFTYGLPQHVPGTELKVTVVLRLLDQVRTRSATVSVKG